MLPLQHCRVVVESHLEIGWELKDDPFETFRISPSKIKGSAGCRKTVMLAKDDHTLLLHLRFRKCTEVTDYFIVREHRRYVP